MTTDRAVLRAHTALQEATHGLLNAALDAREKSDLTVYLYGLAGSDRPKPLFPWEGPWLQRDLPKAPARVLLGAAGFGREAAWLVAAGCQVDAFEPVSRCARSLSRAVGTDGRCAVGDYEDLVAAVLRGERNPLSGFAESRYDAVLVGWGSLTHVLDRGLRHELFVALDTLCPRGPILASFWARDEDANAAPQRARAAGARLGHWVRLARGLPETEDAHDGFRTHGGFTHPFAPSELQALARQVNRRCRLYLDSYPHATFDRPAAG